MAGDKTSGVLIDLAGVLYEGDQGLPGAAPALRRLQGAGLGVRYLTNTTRATRPDVVELLHRLGFPIVAEEIFSAPLAARALLETRGLRPFFVIHPGLLPDFDGVETQAPNAVVVGDAGAAFDYGSLNQAFRLLMAGAPLIAMGRNRYFKEEGGLSLDMGPFVAALEYAAGVEAEVVGKPAPAFFHAALADMECRSEAAWMIGDDLQADIGGAQAAGLRAILVRTGKFRPEDEEDARIRADHVADDFAAAVDWILARTAS